MTAGARTIGDFCWINLLTPRAAEARAFFGELLGWTYSELPGIGHEVLAGGRKIGGLFDLASPSTPRGTPPCIGVMVKVESAGAACDQVKSLGGKAKPPFDIGDGLRMAVCTDPNGAQFDLWEPKKSHGTDADRRHHGAPSWFENLTSDVDRAAKFYSELFGWTPELTPMPGSKYMAFRHGATPIAGALEMTPQMAKLEPHWKTYFTVKDAGETVRRGVELGGSLCMRLHDLPGVGRFCGLASPQGVAFYAIQYL